MSTREANIQIQVRRQTAVIGFVAAMDVSIDGGRGGSLVEQESETDTEIKDRITLEIAQSFVVS